MISVGAIARLTPLGDSFSPSLFLRPLVCSAAAVFAAIIVYALMPDSRLSILAAILAAGIVYLGLNLKPLASLLGRRAEKAGN